MRIICPDKTIDMKDFRDLSDQEHQVTDYYQVQMFKKLVPFTNRQDFNPEVIVRLKSKTDSNNLIRAIIEALLDAKESFDVNKWLADNNIEPFIDTPAVAKPESEIPYETLRKAFDALCHAAADVAKKCPKAYGLPSL